MHFGLHSFASKNARRCKDLMDGGCAVLHHAVIPRGAQYYRGDDGEIISNKLRLGDAVKRTKRRFK